jgi:hypothetical protein
MFWGAAWRASVSESSEAWLLGYRRIDSVSANSFLWDFDFDRLAVAVSKLISQLFAEVISHLRPWQSTPTFESLAPD